MKPVKASGKNYFNSMAFPIAVKAVPAASSAQHPYDLTHISHTHDFSELVIITGGSGIHAINGQEYPVSTGDIFLIQGNSEHYFLQRKLVSHINVMYDSTRIPLSIDWLKKIPGYNVIFELEPNLQNSQNYKSRLHLEQAQLSHVESLVQKMLSEMQSEKDGYEAAVFALLLELIVFISRQYSQSSSPQSTALARLGHIISMIENDCNKKWDLTNIAKQAGMSKSNLLILFKSATGLSPIDYIIQTRLRKSAEALRQTDLSISEIAMDHGFNDSNYFSKMFKKAFNQSPREYRKQL